MGQTNWSKARQGMVGWVTAAMITLAGLPSHVAGLLPEETTSPGKNATFAYSGATTIAPGGVDTIAVTLSKGKPKRVLTVTASLLYAGSGGPGGKPILWAEVNGVRMIGGYGPENWSVFETASGSHSSSVNWWLDLDQAEVDNPGQFKGKPLNVELSLANENSASNSVSMWVTMSVRMEKK